MVRQIRTYSVTVIEFEYLFQEKLELLKWLDQKYGMNYDIKRSGPKIIYPGRCDKELHHMVIHVKK